MSMILNENDRIVYREELAPRLPKRILDAHVHAWDQDAFPQGFQFPPKSCNGRFGGTFTLELFHSLMEELLPEQEVTCNSFGMPNQAACRDKVSTVGRRPRDTVNILLSPEDPAEIVEQRIDAAGAVGVKPYLNYPAAYLHKPANDVEINDMMTPPQLEMLNRRKLAVTLHIPRSGRFSDKLNQRQMIALCEKYPDIRFIFAHIGRAYFISGIRDSNLEEFAQYPNAYFDTAMLNHQGVFQYTFDHFPAERILFGSDSPIAMLRGKSVEINNQYAYLMGEDYHIGTSIIDTEHAVAFTTFYYEQLRALLDTIPAGYLEKVFHDNAQKLFEEIGK